MVSKLYTVEGTVEQQCMQAVLYQNLEVGNKAQFDSFCLVQDIEHCSRFCLNRIIKTSLLGSHSLHRYFVLYRQQTVPCASASFGILASIFSLVLILYFDTSHLLSKLEYFQKQDQQLNSRYNNCYSLRRSIQAVN